jgi:hypothetical protein
MTTGIETKAMKKETRDEIMVISIRLVEYLQN